MTTDVASIIEAMVGAPGSAVAVILLMTASAVAQAPQPFPRPGASAPQTPRTQPATPPAPPVVSAQAPADPNAPTEAVLGVALYPGAQLLGSYDAGRGQRYYVFGTTTGYTEVVIFYQKLIGERGDVVLKDPPTHQFFGEPFARYREETMVFPPGVTVKDWTAGGSPGYPNPKAGAQPTRFPTIIMIATAPPPAAAAPRRE
jgi:hypothetical protein